VALTRSEPRAARTAAPRPERSSRAGASRRAAPWWFVLPAAAFFVFVMVLPSIRGVRYAFTDWDGVSKTVHGVGLRQFRALLADDNASGAIQHTLWLALAITVIQNGVGLLLALAVHTHIRSRNVLRVFLFAPAVITPLATAYLWKYLLAPTGAVNRLLGAVGLGSWRQDWLGNPSIALWSVVAVVVWQFSGYSMVIFLAGLQGIPNDVLEAAAIDGVGPWTKFWHIVRPALAPAFTINITLSVIGGLKLFDQVWVMTNGGPGHATETMSTLIYKNAFQFNEYAYSIAMAVVLAIFVAVLSGAQYGLMSRQRGARA
jgi:raffinose/stachyose/melibiose transport system permease protein